MFHPLTPTRAAAAIAAVWLCAATPSSAGSGGVCPTTSVEQFLASTGIDADGTARARLRQRDDCRQDFSVEIEDLPAGDYEFVVGGVLRGIIAVRATTSGVQGEIEFEGADDDPHPLLLDFDPLGATLEIRLAGVIYFADTFDGTGSVPQASPSATPTGTPREATAVSTPLRTGTPRATRSATAPRTATLARTATPIRTFAATRTRTRTRVPSATRTLASRTRTRVPSPTRTPAATQARTAISVM